MENCTCGSGHAYSSCCGPFIEGKAIPATPEQLMRSRYTAFTQANMHYVQKTMRGKALRGWDSKESTRWAKSATWLGLQILNSSMHQASGTVEFIASYKVEEQLFNMHEVSQFERIAGHWYYLKGTICPE